MLERKQRLPLIMALALSTGLSLSSTCAAEEFTADEIIDALIPHTAVRKPPIEGARSLRGVVLEDEDPAPPSIDMHVEFDYNSANLKPDALVALKQLGVALSDPRLADYSFRISGFTDAAGSDQYNLELSLKRAASVRDFLVAIFAIPTERLDVMGFGESQLADPDHPLDAINRRVQIVNLGG